MLVYGDAERWETAAAARAAIMVALESSASMPAGLARHERLVSAFIHAGELLQGLADREFELAGCDDRSTLQEDGGRLLLILARAVLHSWRTGFTGDVPLPGEWRGLLARLDSPQPLRMKRGEGYAFYALYPETYLEAALRSGLPAETVVIGLRSIGTGLAALVAAALGSGPGITLRPVGHPFDRTIIVGDALQAMLLDRPDAYYAICDEGPGLSGSSFGGVADWLEARGVAPERIVFFPSHAGEPGGQASDRHRERWRSRPRHVVSMDRLILETDTDAHRLQSWVAELVGAPVDDWQDISGGGWRDLPERAGETRPPADRQQEKRKFLAGAGGRRLLVKFAGIGDTATGKAEKAAMLAEAGFTPGFVGTCHGFLVEEWRDGVALDMAVYPRERLIEHVGRYLGFRTRHLPAPSAGASAADLVTMATCNAGEALGDAAAARVSAMLQALPTFHLRPVDTDNRLHAWEWRVDERGRLWKTDALDHSAAHDLIGCQDIGWDIVGAAVEFDLSAGACSRLAGQVAVAAGIEIDPRMLAPLEICYLAFQLGLWTNAAAASGEGEEGEACTVQARRYAARLAVILELPG